MLLDEASRSILSSLQQLFSKQMTTEPPHSISASNISADRVCMQWDMKDSPPPKRGLTTSDRRRIIEDIPDSFVQSDEGIGFPQEVIARFEDPVALDHLISVP